jgi:hypothetical protein
VVLFTNGRNEKQSAFVRMSERNDESILKACVDLAKDIKEIKFQPHDVKK